MSLNVQAIGKAEVAIGLKTKSLAILANVRKAIVELTIDLQRHVVQDKLHGQVLNFRSGALARSIYARIENDGDLTTGIVGTIKKYAAIHEYGGTIPAHIVEARNASVLAFTPKGASETWFAKRVMIPDVQMPERSFLRSALHDMTAEIRTRLDEAVHEGAAA